MEKRGRRDFIRASGMSEYTFCARAWWLRREGVKPTLGATARAAGERWHEGHGRTVSRARRLRLIATLCTFLAGAVALILIWLQWRG